MTRSLSARAHEDQEGVERMRAAPWHVMGLVVAFGCLAGCSASTVNISKSDRATLCHEMNDILDADSRTVESVKAMIPLVPADPTTDYRAMAIDANNRAAEANAATKIAFDKVCGLERP